MIRHHASLLDRLAAAPLVGDGAMGTYLHELGHDIRQGPESLVLSDPDAVRRVHAAYVEAGAELLETNTFGANALSLAAQEERALAREVNAAAARLALEAADGRAWVAGSIGPVPWTTHDEAWDSAAALEAYREQAQALVSAGVHALLLETFEDLDLLRLALRACRAAAGEQVPIIAQMVYADGHASGLRAEEIARRLVADGAAVVGANCGRGLPSIRTTVDGLMAGCGDRAFVSAYPNAGYPEQLRGRTVYLSTPAYIAEQAAAWARRGVRLIGGCCGTTPETIRAIRQALAGLRRVPALRMQSAVAAPAATPVTPAVPPTPATAGGFLKAIEGMRLPAIAELDPPPHLDWQPTLAGARALLDAGAQAISLAENPLASIRMDNLFVGAAIRRATGGHVVCHVTCRDRNSLGLQSALLGAHAAGIEAVLAVTGDPAPPVAHGRVVSVYELTSLGLVRLAAGMNQGRSATGRDLKGSTRFSIGVAFNSAAPNLAAETARLRRKAGEGAAFVMTQPVFEPDHARRVLEAARSSGLRVFLGFLPPVTLKLARYLHHEVPGIRLPDDLLRKLEALPQVADQERAALEHTANLLDVLAEELDGVYLIAPGTRWRVLLPLLDRIQTHRRLPASDTRHPTPGRSQAL